LYFGNILRLTEVVSWIVLPASILFILFFFWGLPEKYVFLLMGIFYFLVIPTLVSLLYMAVLKMIQTQQKTLTIYAEAFRDFWPFVGTMILYFLKVLLWSLPALLPGIGLGLWAVALRESGILWTLSFIFLIPGAILAFIAVMDYSFSGMAFLLDGKKGREALRFSKGIVRPNLRRFIQGLIVVMIWMTLGYALIGPWAAGVYDMSLLGALLPILFHVCLVNITATLGGVFPAVFFYCLYRELSHG